MLTHGLLRTFRQRLSFVTMDVLLKIAVGCVSLFCHSALATPSFCSTVFWEPSLQIENFNHGLYSELLGDVQGAFSHPRKEVGKGLEKQWRVSQVLSFIVALDVKLENLHRLDEWSRFLPGEFRDLFQKMAVTLANARVGELHEIVKFLEQLLVNQEYARWLDLVAELHFAHRTGGVDGKAFPSEIVVSDSVRSFYKKVGLAIEADPNQYSYPFFDQPLLWRNQSSLKQHFKKRVGKDGLKMNHQSELLAAANDFLMSRRDQQISFVRHDGVVVKYDSATKELAIVSAENRIITYYFVNNKYRSAEEQPYNLVDIFTRDYP